VKRAVADLRRLELLVSRQRDHAEEEPAGLEAQVDEPAPRDLQGAWEAVESSDVRNVVVPDAQERAPLQRIELIAELRDPFTLAILELHQGIYGHRR
jgi:hypothetical protein